MATVSRGLPKQPHLDVPKREARELLNSWRKGEHDAVERVQHRHPRFREATTTAERAGLAFRLSDAQLVVAREYGFERWADLKRRVESDSLATALHEAIRANDRTMAVRIVRMQPQLLHLPLVSGNWGPPMSHAANLGRLEIVEAMAEVGARDFQHAFDRALLQGQIETARWLHSRGAKPVPGIFMGTCETLKASGFRFLLDLGVPLANEHGDRLAPLALVLETYARNPAGKHAILEMFAGCGYELPDTPVMAFHRGDIGGLERHLRREPDLLGRRFALREIYPPECGCMNDGRSGMHWTPVDGTTLLHLAVDFREQEIFDWLLARGADVNAGAVVDRDGFGAHTPLFNALVNGPERGAVMARTLLERGADPAVRASLRKFLDWRETPGWHAAREVTPLEWARDFPDRTWVNPDAFLLVDQVWGNSRNMGS